MSHIIQATYKIEKESQLTTQLIRIEDLNDLLNVFIDGVLVDKPTETGIWRYTFNTLGEHTVILEVLSSHLLPYFQYANRLTKVIIPEGITGISSYAIIQTDITELFIPSSVILLDSYAIHWNDLLTTIVVDSNNPVYDSRENCNCIIETATNTLINGSINSFIPNSVTSIGSSAFTAIGSKLSEWSITIPNSVTIIDDYAFKGTELTSITIPNSVTGIGTRIFDTCTKLTTVVIGEGVTTMGNSVFYQCNNLEKIICKAQKAPSAQYSFTTIAKGGTLYVPVGATGYNEGGWKTLTDTYEWNIVYGGNYLIATPKSINVDHNEQTVRINVSTTSQQWNVTKCEWFEIVGNESATLTYSGNQDLDLHIKANDSMDERVNYLYITDLNDEQSQMITVTQAGEPAYYNIEPESLIWDSRSYTQYLTINTNDEFGLNIEGDFQTSLAPTGEQYHWRYNITSTENTTGAVRQGKVTVLSSKGEVVKEIPLIQDYIQFAITPNRFVCSGDPQVITLNVTNSPGITQDMLTISSTVEGVSIESFTSGEYIDLRMPANITGDRIIDVTIGVDGHIVESRLHITQKLIETSVIDLQVNFDAGYGSKSLELALDGQWYVKSRPSFVQVVPSSGKDDHTIELVVDVNTLDRIRVGVVNIVSDVLSYRIIVKQDNVLLNFDADGDVIPICEETEIVIEDTDQTEYHISIDDKEIYSGMVFSYPNSTNVEIFINEIVSDYLSNYIQFTTGVGTMNGYMRKVTVTADNGYSEDFYFYDAWEEPQTVILNAPISNEVDPRQYIFVNYIDGYGNLQLYEDGNLVNNSTSVSCGYYSPVRDIYRACGSKINYTARCGEEVLGVLQYQITSADKDYALYYVNAFGGWDSLLLKGHSTQTDNFTSHTYRSERRGTVKYVNKINPTWSLNTDDMNDSSRMYHLIESPEVYLHNLKTNEIIPVIITDSNCVYKTYANQGNTRFYYTINVEASKYKIRK